MTDPSRWIEGGGPAGAKEVLRAIPMPPAMPPKVRSESLAKVPRRGPQPWHAAAALALAAIVLLAVWLRPRDKTIVAESTLRPEPDPALSHVDSPTLPEPAPGAEGPAIVGSGRFVAIWEPPARIFIDGEEQGTSPVLTELPAGTYTVEVELPSGDRMSSYKTVAAGELTTLTNLGERDFEAAFARARGDIEPEETLEPTQARRPRIRRRSEPEPEPEATVSTGRPRTPADVMRQCGVGNNRCLVGELSLLPHTPTRDSILIETYRSMGQGSTAERLMREFVQRYPTNGRAARYRRMLFVGDGNRAPQNGSGYDVF